MLVGKTFIDPWQMPFSRRGSYISLAGGDPGSNQYAKAQLWISTSRLGRSEMTSAFMGENVFQQIKIEVIKDNIVRNGVIHTTPYELTFESDSGSADFCIGEPRLMRCRGSNGVSLRFTPKPGRFGNSSITNLHNGSFKAQFGNAFLHFTVHKGSFSDMGMYLELTPDAEGFCEAALEEFVNDPIVRGSYPSYERCVELVKTDFDGFSSSLVKDLPVAYRDYGLKAAWIVWGLTVVPDGETAYKHRMVKMMRLIFEGAFSWQQGMHAFFLSRDPEFSWEVLLSAFDVQDKNGRIADSLSPSGGGGATMKPPIEGLGLLWQMEHFDISKKPVSELEFLYTGMVRWAEYYLKFRDIDRDGIFENQNAGETGWENGSYQRIGFPLAAPDMNAYLALLEEAIAKLGRILGRDEAVNNAWEHRSADTIKKLIDMFWTDEGWITINVITKEKSKPTSIIPYCVLVLGKRLPQNIIDRSIELIFEPGKYETEFGLASEQLDSPYFSHGWCGGSIATPVQALIAVGLDLCGRPDLSKRIAIPYLDTIKRAGCIHIHNPISGEEEYRTRHHYCSGWTAGCYLFFASRYAE